MPYTKDSEDSDSDIETAPRRRIQTSPAWPGSFLSRQQVPRRASSAGAEMQAKPTNSASTTPTPPLSRHQSQSRKRKRSSSSSLSTLINTPPAATLSTKARPWSEPPLSRDHLILRPSQAQRDFLRKRIGYNGFYYQPAFDNGSEPYGYPDKDLPRFLGGEVPDRMGWSELQRRLRVARGGSKRARRGEGPRCHVDVYAEPASVQHQRQEQGHNRRRTTRALEDIAMIKSEDAAMPSVEEA